MTTDVQTSAAATARAAVAARSGRAESGGETAAGAAAGDFQTFLTLLTAQMRNQDPLKPIESTEFVTQLASFSAVEQQIQSNERLEAIHEALGGGAGLSDWIGKEVQSAADIRHDGETPVTVTASPVAGATRAVLVVRGASGAEVARIAADPEAERLEWSGETFAGPAPAGRYRFEVEYFEEDALLGTSDGLAFARVQELRLGGEEPMLVLAGGSEIRASEVSAVRSAAPED